MIYNMQVYVDQYRILVCDILEAFDLHVKCITLIIQYYKMHT